MLSLSREIQFEVIAIHARVIQSLKTTCVLEFIILAEIKLHWHKEIFKIRQSE